MEINNIEKNLRNNTLFNLSLGSKELFHSNLLAGILSLNVPFGLEFSKSLISELFLKNLNEVEKHSLLNNTKFIEVDREASNIDLVITLKSEEDNEQTAKTGGNILKKIVIENKVKSLPYTDQLKKYEAKHVKNKQKTDFILLSLIELNEDQKKEAPNWVQITYNDVKESLQRILDNNNSINLPELGGNIKFKDFIREYIDFLEALVKIMDMLIASEDESLEFCEAGKYKDIEFRKLRIHDLLYKLKYEQIKMFIANEISKDNKISAAIKSGEIRLSSSFSDGSGISDVDIQIGTYKINSSELTYSLTIQLQSNNFKYASVLKGKDVSKTELISIHKKIIPIVFENWFETIQIQIPEIYSVLNKKGEFEKYKGKGDSTFGTDGRKYEFNGYKGTDYTFYYKYDVLNTSIQIRDIVEFFKRLTNLAISIKENLYHEIKAQLEL